MTGPSGTSFDAAARDAATSIRPPPSGGLRGSAAADAPAFDPGARDPAAARTARLDAPSLPGSRTARLAGQARHRRDAYLRPAGTDPVTRLRVHGVGFGRARVPGSDRWHCCQRVGPRASACRAGGRPPAHDLAHTSNLFGNVPSVLLAERLVKILELPPATDARVFFCNSGAEANEAAIKIAFRTGRRAMVSAEGSFHGRTLGALSITGQPAKRAPSSPCWGRSRSSPTAMRQPCGKPCPTRPRRCSSSRYRVRAAS